MADLFMTIDSDSEQDIASSKKGKKANTAPKDEEIQLAHSVILQDTDLDFKRKSKHTTGHIVGSNNHWNFTESLQMDAARTHVDNDSTNADEKAPFLQEVEERVERMMHDKKIKLPEDLTDLANVEKNDKEINLEGGEIPKEDATIHYDKEDLISFH